MMKPVIEAVDRQLIKQELNEKRFLRPTNKANNEIYVITAHDSPHTMREIGRLRELSFRSGGGGTGDEIDVDAYDFLEKPFKQLIVWDPQAEEIIGGYRFLSGQDVEMDEKGQPKFVMSHLFRLSEKFISDYLPYTIELGRAFVQPVYQTSKMGMKSLFALDNLWDGLGALIHSTKGAKYFIGKVTIYNSYPLLAREMIYEYMYRYFPDADALIVPKAPIAVSAENNALAKSLFSGNDRVDDYKVLQKAVRSVDETIPPLYNAYIGLTDTMRFFGVALDNDFGAVYEAGILVTMDDLLESKRKRYIDPYIDYLMVVLEERRQAKKKAKEEKEKAKALKIKEKEKAKAKKLKEKEKKAKAATAKKLADEEKKRKEKLSID